MKLGTIAIAALVVGICARHWIVSQPAPSLPLPEYGGPDFSVFDAFKTEQPLALPAGIRSGPFLGSGRPQFYGGLKCQYHHVFTLPAEQPGQPLSSTAFDALTNAVIARVATCGGTVVYAAPQTDAQFPTHFPAYHCSTIPVPVGAGYSMLYSCGQRAGSISLGQLPSAGDSLIVGFIIDDYPAVSRDAVTHQFLQSHPNAVAYRQR